MEMAQQEISITPKMLKLIAELDEFKGRWSFQGQLFPKRLDGWKKAASLESIGSSARLHGSKLTDGEIKEFLSGRYTNTFKNKDEEDVAGIAELIDFVLERHPELSLDEGAVKEMYLELFQFSPVEAKSTGELKKLMAALNQDWENAEFHKLLVIAVFVGRFLAEHPFQHGGLRLSRGLATMLLLKAGYKFAAYSSLDRVMEGHKRFYTSSIQKAERGDSESWVHFFLECLARQKNNLAKKVEKERLLTSMPRQSSKIVQALRDHESMSVSELCNLLGDNRNTIKVHLFRLVENGQIKSEGKGKGTRYLLL